MEERDPRQQDATENAQTGMAHSVASVDHIAERMAHASISSEHEVPIYNAEEMDEPTRDSHTSDHSKSWIDAAKSATMEKLQTGVDFVKEKAHKVAENETVQQGVGFVKEKSKMVKETMGEGVDSLKVKSKKAWVDGRGRMERARNQIREGEWKGSAKKTLGVSEKEGLWKDIKVKGAEEMTVPARNEHTTAYLVPKGTLLRWTFRVMQYDLGFGVRMRVMQDGGAVENVVLPVERFDDQETVSGSWMAEEDRTMILVFDNSYSKLRGKTVAYMVGIETAPDIDPVEVTMAGRPSEAPAQVAEEDVKETLPLF
eukprot:GEMP01021688.1.p1 GENE.GEMP01021688.1~~GEMP01021688.1.p1  ORF type:complete len:313 (+),score=95.06 GEMP01021688.1:47-985(+)